MFNSLDSDNRKHEFMRTALALFYSNGYENTKITDICNELDVTKGAFYYYFQSKEDVLAAIAEAYTDRSVQIIKSIMQQKELSAVEKMNKIFKSINELKFSEKDLRYKFKTVLKSEANLKLQHELMTAMKRAGSLSMRELIKEGVEEGSFGDPVCIDELADFLLNTIFSLNIAIDDLENDLHSKIKNKQQILDKIIRKVHFYEVMLERVFKVKEGSFDLINAYKIRLKGKT